MKSADPALERLADATGLFGPGSMAWRIDREVLILAGGSCALLLQAAHPAVAAAVSQHSTYRTDPFGRLLRTLSSSFSVVFGTRSRATATIRRVNAIHAGVRGRVTETGAAYSALEPEALLWVHATLVDTALRVYERFIRPLDPAEADRYNHEAIAVAAMLGIPARRVPPTVAELRSWMADMRRSRVVRVTHTARDIARTILVPRRFPPRVVWEAAHLISVATLPPDIRAGYGLAWGPRRERVADLLAVTARHALPLLPPTLRFVPHARSAEARVRRARRAAEGGGRAPEDAGGMMGGVPLVAAPAAGPAPERGGGAR